MVNEQRLHSMIKIAKFDANDGKRCKPMIQYARKDYVALQLLKSFVVGTIAFFMMLGLWVLYSMDALMEQINKMDFVKAATTLGLLYGIFMVIYLLATYIIFNMKYTYGRKKVKKYYAGLKKISAMYLREELFKPHMRKWADEATKTAVWEVYKFIHVNTVAPFGTFRTKIRKWKKIAL